MKMDCACAVVDEIFESILIIVVGTCKLDIEFLYGTLETDFGTRRLHVCALLRRNAGPAAHKCERIVLSVGNFGWHCVLVLMCGCARRNLITIP